MRNKYVDILRFVSAIFIMLYHTNVMTGFGRYPFQGAYMFVELFLMITGYYTVLHWKQVKNDETNCAWGGILYTVRKWKNIFFYSSIIIIVDYIYEILTDRMSVKEAFFNIPYEITFLTQLGFGKQYVGQLWYLAAVFIMLPVFIFIIKCFKGNWSIVGMLPLFYYGYCALTTGHIGGTPIIWQTMWRSLCGLIMGYNVYWFSQWIRKHNGGEKKLKVIAGGTLGGTILITGVLAATTYDFVVIALIFIMLSCVTAINIENENRKYYSLCVFLGKISLPLYICQNTTQLVVMDIFADCLLVVQVIVWISVSIFIAFMMLMLYECVIKFYCVRNKEKGYGDSCQR